MAPQAILSAQQLLELPSDGQRYELVAGELRVMSPSGWRHGKVVGTMHGLLWQHVSGHHLGLVFGAETGFLLARDPDTVRAPDVAFVDARNLPGREPSEAYWPGAPDLAVEVLSPHDRADDVDEKIRAWLAAGTRSVWVVDPQLRTLTEYRSTGDVTVYTAGQRVDGGELLPGFSCPVARIFTEHASP
ncbi:MAG: Uma2 family endonuclease [Pirellulaceae bacterium]|nr:Uma2 family endonuclease [Pirellulaceae bacterium]